MPAPRRLHQKITSRSLLRTALAILTVGGVLAATQLVNSTHETDSAYATTSNAKSNSTVSMVPAYSMTCSTPMIDYGVTDDGKVYYGTGNSYVDMSETGPLVGKIAEQLVCNNSTIAVLDSLGDVYAWQISEETVSKIAIPFQPGENGIQITSTQSSISTLTSEGRVFSFGGNTYGELGNGSVGGSPTSNITPFELQSTYTPSVPLTELAGGERGVIGLAVTGDVVQWGADENGNGYAFARLVPSGATATEPIRSVGAYRLAFLALDYGGKLHAWGRGVGLGNGSSINTTSQITDPYFKPFTVNPYGSLGNRNVTKLFSEWNGGVYAVTNDGVLHAWTAAPRGMGPPPYPPIGLPARVMTSGVLQGKTVTSIFPGVFVTSVQVAEDNSLYWWGYAFFINLTTYRTDPQVTFGSQQLVPR